jgi:hypothetical protein
VQDVEDVAEQRGMRRVVPGQRLEHPGDPGHRERQHQSLGLGQSEGVCRGLGRRAPVPELVVGQRGQQVRFDDGRVADDRCRAVEDVA